MTQLQGKQAIDLVQSALEARDGGESLKVIARENPNYLNVWLKHANLTKTQMDLHTEIIMLTMSLIISTESNG